MSGFQKTDRTAFVNFLRAKRDMYTGAVQVATRPYYMSIDPSDRCQLRCPTCPTGIENEGRKTKELEAQVFRSQRHRMTSKLFDALMEELGEYLFLVMFYNYGEPLLNTNLASFIKKAKTYRIETELHTNLSLRISDERIEDILTSGLDRLLASIDGFSQEVYEIHRVGGDFALAKKNLEQFVRTRDRLGLETHIAYGFLVFSFNEHEAAKAQRYCRDLGIEFEGRQAFVDDPSWLPSYRKGEKPWLVPQDAQVKKGAAWGWSPLPNVDKARAPSACGWHYGYSVVTAGGHVAPCCAVARSEYDLGEVVPGTIPFGDVWNNERYVRSRAAFAGHEAPDGPDADTICTRCPYPAGIHHLYSVHDMKVLRQFRSVFHDTDPVLEKGFDLLSRARYGVPLAAAAENDFPVTLDYLFVGNEGKNATADFVHFVERNLAA
jgi:MoaA/NifB/PqqE/SkfB family radical SAM enzyme